MSLYWVDDGMKPRDAIEAAALCTMIVGVWSKDPAWALIILGALVLLVSLLGRLRQ